MSQTATRASALASALMRAAAGNQERGRVSRAIARRLRSTWLRFGDPAVTYRWGDVGTLTLPLSHDLPAVVAAHPGYGLNLRRLAEKLARAKSDFVAMDIGANVGDTARLLRRSGAGAVLCIEGAAEFLPYLGTNLTGDPSCAIEPVFVAAAAGALMRVTARGSSHFAPATTGAAMTGSSIRDIVARHPSFAKPRLIKLDTDGLDLAILATNSDWVAEVRPILFLEYLPFLFRPHGIQGADSLRQLARLGYDVVIVYDNFGRFLCRLSLQRWDSMADEVLRYFERNDTEYYADIAVFPEADAELATRIAASESALST